MRTTSAGTVIAALLCAACVKKPVTAPRAVLIDEATEEPKEVAGPMVPKSN